MKKTFIPCEIEIMQVASEDIVRTSLGGFEGPFAGFGNGNTTNGDGTIETPIVPYD